MSKKKTRYPNIYYDDVRKKYEYRKMINGAIISGRADTLSEAKELLSSSLSKNIISKKNVLPSFDTILNEYLKDKKSDLKVTTWYKRKNIFNLYFHKRFRNVPIDKLVFADFQKWYSFIKKKDIAICSKNQYLSILRSLFDYVRITYEYDCLFVKRLKRFKDYSIKNPNNCFKIFSYDDFKKLYPTLNEYDQLLLLTLFLFGLRAGELLALTPKAFIFDENICSIYQAVSWKVSKKGYMLIPPKSKTSNRTYPISSLYKEKMLKHINDNNLKEDNFIFFSPLSKKNPLSSTSLQRKTESWSKVVGYHLYPHLFRHSAISQLYASGLNINLIQRLVGHSSSNITKEVYLHQTEESTNILNDFIDKLIG